jgi:nucleoside-diphosphate-sugar epimerase
MKILLTGGSGFLGRSLREALRGVHEIVAPSHRDLDVADTNAMDEAIRNGRYDAVVHAALAGGERIAEHMLRGFWNIAGNAERVARVVYFGSGAEYGKHRDLVKVREDEIGREIPRNSYGFAKLMCNDIARRSRNITNLRLFGVYGPHEGYLFKFISNSVVKTLLGMDLAIRQDVVFDYLWIGDLCAVVESLLEKEPLHRDLNVTPTESVSLSGIVQALEAACGRPIRAEYETPGLNFQYTGDNSRLREVLPELRFTGIPEGVKRLYGYYAARIDEIDRDAVEADEYRKRAKTRRSGDA